MRGALLKKDWTASLNMQAIEKTSEFYFHSKVK